MRVLVTYGTKAQATAEIAAIVGDTLRSRGHEVDVANAKEDHAVAPYDAVIVGGALYAWRWVRSASRFVKRHERELLGRPVWFFSSGPLDDSALKGDLKPVGQVRRLAERVHAVEHKTFGGRLLPDRRMAALPIGDWRNQGQIASWAAHVADELETERAKPRPQVHFVRPWGLAALCLFSGLTGLFGGITLLAAPDGSLLRLPLSVLQFTPFDDFFLPALLLLGVGVVNFVAGLFAPTGRRGATVLAGVAGAVMVGWIVAEMMLLRTTHWAQLFYLAVGLATVAEAWRVRRTLTQV